MERGQKDEGNKLRRITREKYLLIYVAYIPALLRKYCFTRLGYMDALEL
jgi:hypothetical protein